MIRAAALFWLLLVVLSGMTGAVMLSGNYQLRALDEALGRALRAAIQERRESALPTPAAGNGAMARRAAPVDAEGRAA
jgi:hypothetical protein